MSVLSNSLEALFEQFWDAYPKKKAKGLAQQAWARLKPTSELLMVMLAAINRQRATLQWTRDNGQYIPYPATWLNQRRWEDGDDGPPSAVSDTARHNLVAMEEATRRIQEQTR
jgi:hypothetical protein